MDNNTFENFSSPAPEQSPEQQSAAPNPENSFPVQKEQPVHTGIFFGLEALFSIPLIGLIASIIFSFAPQNKNLKNYARAKMIWSIISLILSVFLIIGSVMIVRTVTAEVQKKMDEWSSALEEFAGGAFIEEFIGQIDGIDDIGNLIGQVGQISDVGDIVEMFGGAEALEGAVQEFGAEKMDQIAEILQDPVVINEIVEEVSELDGIEEAIEDVGGVDRLAEVDDINELMRMATQVKDPETREQILNIIRSRIE